MTTERERATVSLEIEWDTDGWPELTITDGEMGLTLILTPAACRDMRDALNQYLDEHDMILWLSDEGEG